MVTEQQNRPSRGGYLDKFKRTLDASRRVMIPSEWREADPAPDYTILPWPLSKPQYLIALPPQRWALLVERMGATSLSDPTAGLVQRAIASSAVRVKPDGNGRLVLPEDLLKRLNIEKEVYLVGRLELFEIWNPATFESQQDYTEQVDKIIASWNI